jgi:phage/plasmid primase-like uncharacterized protein
LPTVRELAAQFGLHNAGRYWRGRCPACGYAEAFLLANRKTGIIGWCASCGDQEAIAQAIGDPLRAIARPRDKDDGAAQSRRLERAERIWLGSESVANRPAAAYLVARRIGHLIGCPELRFRADCPHPTGTVDRPMRLPALIAAVRDADGNFIGIHRTYLRRDGSSKADIEPQKASLGLVRGGAVRLVSLDEVRTAGELVLAEGIETAAAASLLLDLPAWAAISAGNLAHGVVLPADIHKVVIAADRDSPDEHGRCAGQQAARDAWFRFRHDGREVHIALPDEGRGDFSDLLAARAHGL